MRIIIFVDNFESRKNDMLELKIKIYIIYIYMNYD